MAVDYLTALFMICTLAYAALGTLKEADWKIAKRRLNDVVQENQELVQKPAYVEQEAGKNSKKIFA